MDNRYMLVRCSSGEFTYVHAADRKEAHEAGQARWPGETVSVATMAEATDTVVWQSHHNQMEDWFDGIRNSIYESDYPDIVRCLDAIDTHLKTLRAYFSDRARKASQAAGKGGTNV